ncbi:MAG TPA: hypothetical protein VFJ16_13820 [Longimicrobium sp.]|nr:hypothetical protein [Longimicrobium sp.]
MKIYRRVTEIVCRNERSAGSARFETWVPSATGRSFAAALIPCSRRTREAATQDDTSVVMVDGRRFSTS